MIAGAGGGLGDHLPGDEDAFAGFTGDADDKVFTCHVRGPPPAIDRRWSAQVRATPEHLAERRPSPEMGAIRRAVQSYVKRVRPTHPPSDTAERVQVVEKQQSGLGRIIARRARPAAV